MAKYVPSPQAWVSEQVELYESSGGAKGTALRDTGLPVVIVTHRGNKTGAIRKTPLMQVKDGDNYILVGSQGGAPKIRPGYITCAPISISSFAMRPSYARCTCVRSRTRRKGLVCGHWPWRHTRHTRNIRRARNVKFRSLSPSRNLRTRGDRIGTCRLLEGMRKLAGSAQRLKRRNEPCPPLVRPGQAAASSRSVCSGSRMVHRRLRHARSEGGEGVAGGLGVVSLGNESGYAFLIRPVSLKPKQNCFQIGCLCLTPC